MKKLIYGLFMVAAFSACDAVNSDLVNEFDYDPFVSFDRSSVEVDENAEAGTATVNIILTGPAQSADIVVELSAKVSENGEGIVTLPSATSVTIPAGEFSVPYTISYLNNEISDGNKVIDLAITGASGFAIATEKTGVATSKIVIVDDDCPLVGDWVGSYIVEEEFTAGGNAGLSLSGAFGESYLVEITMDPTDPSGTTAILTNANGYNTYFDDGTLMKFVTCSGDILFPGGDPAIADGFFTLELEAASYDANAQTVRVDGDSNGYGKYGLTLRKQ